MESFKEEVERQDGQRPVGYQRKPRKKRRKTMGVIAFCLAFLTLLTLAALGAYAFLRFRGNLFSGGDLTLVTVAIIVCAAVAGIALILAVTTLFLRRQRKGLAVAGLLISLAVLLICVAAMYVYQYIFADLRHDEAMNALAEAELNVVEIENGEVIRETEALESTASVEELERLAREKEVEFESLSDGEIPEEALAKMDAGDPVGPSYLLFGSEQITNFLLFGTDVNDSSDSIIVLSLDRVHRKIKLISIPRDSYVLMPQWGSYAKLAYAYTWGGAQLAVSTVNRNYALNVTDYVAVDFDQLKEIIDLLGGIDVELGEEDYGYNSHMTGAQALRYSRDRSDSELNRTKRQRRVITAILDALRQKPITEYPAFIRTCLGMCTTSFSSSELIELCMEVTQNSYGVESYSVLEHVDYWGGKLGEMQYFYVVYDLNRASDWMYRAIYEDLYVSGYEAEKAAQ